MTHQPFRFVTTRIACTSEIDGRASRAHGRSPGRRDLERHHGHRVHSVSCPSSRTGAAGITGCGRLGPGSCRRGTAGRNEGDLTRKCDEAACAADAGSRERASRGYHSGHDYARGKCHEWLQRTLLHRFADAFYPQSEPTARTGRSQFARHCVPPVASLFELWHGRSGTRML